MNCHASFFRSIRCTVLPHSLPGVLLCRIPRSIRGTVMPHFQVYQVTCYTSYAPLLGELLSLVLRSIRWNAMTRLHLYRVYWHASFLVLSGELLFLVRISIRGSIIPRFKFYWVNFTPCSQISRMCSSASSARLSGELSWLVASSKLVLASIIRVV